MKTDRKIIISLLVFILVISLCVIFIIYPLFNEIRKESEDLFAQKNILAGLEIKAKNLQKFQVTYENYEPDLEKINEVFVNPAEPVSFIEFLEKQASQSQLFIEILPLVPEKAGKDLWPSMNFHLVLAGSFPDFLKFFEKLELSPYLIETLNLNTRRLYEGNIKAEKFKGFSVGDVNVSLSVKAYTKE